jgi:hypothetical protein
MTVFKEKNGAMKGVAFRADRQARRFGPAFPLSSRAFPHIPKQAAILQTSGKCARLQLHLTALSGKEVQARRTIDDKPV